MAILPMVDPLWKMEVTGEQILLALENGVSQYPNLEGRFPQVSGISFTFDPSQPSGSRIPANGVFIGEERLQRTKTYTLCTKGYIASGKDGYSVFRDAKILIDHEAGIILNSEVRNYFQWCRQTHVQNNGLCRSCSPFKTKAMPSRLVMCTILNKWCAAYFRSGPRIEKHSRKNSWKVFKSIRGL